MIIIVIINIFICYYNIGADEQDTAVFSYSELFFLIFYILAWKTRRIVVSLSIRFP